MEKSRNGNIPIRKHGRMSVRYLQLKFSDRSMVWIDEVDFARNMEELKSCSSISGRIIPDIEVLDTKIASALKKLLTADFKRRVYMEEQKAQQDTIDS